MDKQVIEAAMAEAEKFGVDPAALMAVIEVESAGIVFANINGKSEPLIRFEGHWFDRRLESSSKARARLQGLAAEKAGIVKNPASQSGRWALLEKAMKINRQAALESTSWGIGQVMGGHWKWLGYSAVDALVEEARSGAGGQMSLMLRFIEKSGLVAALKIQDWKRFAQTYNGPDANRHGYDGKLQSAFERWRHHDWSSAAQIIPATTSPLLRRGSTGDLVTSLQDLLSARGFPAKPTALFDAQTERAVRAFQKQAGLASDGIAGPLTMKALSTPPSGKSVWRCFMDWLLDRNAKI